MSEMFNDNGSALFLFLSLSSFQSRGGFRPKFKWCKFSGGEADLTSILSEAKDASARSAGGSGGPQWGPEAKPRKILTFRLFETLKWLDFKHNSILFLIKISNLDSTSHGKYFTELLRAGEGELVLLAKRFPSYVILSARAIKSNEL